MKNNKKWWFLDCFLNILSFRSNFSAPNCQIQTQWTILLLWTPMGSLRASKQWSYLYLKFFSAVFLMLAPPGEKNCLLQIEASCHLYYFSWLKSDNITFQSHKSMILKEIHSFKPWFWNISIKKRSLCAWRDQNQSVYLRV